MLRMVARTAVFFKCSSMYLSTNHAKTLKSRGFGRWEGNPSKKRMLAANWGLASAKTHHK